MEHQNPVGFLQELCQKRSLEFPHYEEIGSTGPCHAKLFTLQCSFQGLETKGSHRLKKQAKCEAAKEMILLLKKCNHIVKIESHGSEENQEEVVYDKNPISALHEYCQKAAVLPKFVESDLAGNFICQCSIGDAITHGNDTNKKGAKLEAALKMCEKLNIKCAGVGTKQSQELEDKNPVSAIHEYCTRLNRTLCFMELPKENNLFVTQCSVGSSSFVGRGLNKKLAKNEAASKALKELNHQHPYEQPQGVSTASKDVNSNATNNVGQSSLPVVNELKDFQLDPSDDEAEDLSVQVEKLCLDSECGSSDVPDSTLKTTNGAQQEPDESSISS